MTNKKEISLEELENVTGGKASDRNLPNPHGIHVGKYKAPNYKGRVFYAVHDYNDTCYGKGVLIDSTELDCSDGGTERCHLIQITEMHGYLWHRVNGMHSRHFYVAEAPGTYWISGDNSTLYLAD